MRIPEPSALARKYLNGLADPGPIDRAELQDLAMMARVAATRLQAADPGDLGGRARIAGSLALIALGALELAIRPGRGGSASAGQVEGFIVIGKRLATVREASCNFCGWPLVAIDEGDGPPVIFDAPGDGAGGWRRPGRPPMRKSSREAAPPRRRKGGPLMAAGFVLKGGNGGRKALVNVEDLDALAAAVRLSADRNCRVLLTRDGITLAAFDGGKLIDPGMSDFPEARPATRPAGSRAQRED